MAKRIMYFKQNTLSVPWTRASCEGTCRLISVPQSAQELQSIVRSLTHLISQSIANSLKDLHSKGAQIFIHCQSLSIASLRGLFKGARMHTIIYMYGMVIWA